MELTPDIQTGRNVYADKDLYESDDTYKAKIDSYVNEGFKLVYGSPDEPSEGGGGSGGSDSGVMIIHENWSLDKTMGEIWEAVQNGTILVLVDDQGNYYQGAKVCVNDDGSSYYGAVTFNGGQMWEARSADAYPEPNV